MLSNQFSEITLGRRCGCGEKMVRLLYRANASVPAPPGMGLLSSQQRGFAPGPTMPVVPVMPDQELDVCVKCDRERFRESNPLVHQWLNRDQLTTEQRMYRSGRAPWRFAAFKKRDGSYKGPIIRRVLRCKRLFAEFPKEAFWIGALQLKYRDARVCNNICPHRGISLKGVEDNGCGTVVCPGHGLEWDKRDGRLVSRVSIG